MIRLACALVLGVGVAATTATAQPPDPCLKLYERGRVELAAGKFDAALKTLAEAEKLAADKYGADHPNTALVVYEVGEVYLRMEEYKKAEAAYLKVLPVREKWFGKENPSTTNAYDRLGEVYTHLHEFEKAESLLLAALATRVKHLDAKHYLIGRSYTNLGAYYKEVGQYDKAEDYYRKAVVFQVAAKGRDSLQTAFALNDLGRLLTYTGNFKDAVTALRRALTIAETAGESAKLSMHIPLGNLADALAASERYTEAERLYTRALRSAEAAGGPDGTAAAFVLVNLGQLHSKTKRMKSAEELTRQALAIYEKTLGPDAILTAQTRAALGMILLEAGDHGRADAALTAALRTVEARQGKDHPDVAALLNDLGLLYNILGLYDRAEPLHLRALAIREKVFGKNHPVTATSLVNLGDLAQNREQYAKAEAYYDRARAILEASYGRRSARLALVLANLYRLKIEQEKKVRLDLLLQSLDIFETQLGKDHPSTARTRANLGYGYYRAFQYDKAEPLIREALAALREAHGDAAPDTIEVAKMLAYTLYAAGRRDDAVRTMEGIRRNTRQYVTSVLVGLPDADQRAFLKSRDADAIAKALTMGLDNRDRPDVALRSAAWLVNGKASVQEVRAFSVQAANAGDAPAAAELRDVRAELARLTLAGGADPTAAAHRQALREREGQLAVALRDAGSRLDRPLPWVELDEIRKRLPEGAVYVDVARFQPARLVPVVGERTFGPARYAAWVLPKDGPVRIIDLGLAEEIEELVLAVRKALTDTPDAIGRSGEATAEKRLRRSLDVVSARVLHPLLKEIGSASRWVFSPDGALWLLPWPALTLPDGKYAVEAHTIRTVICGRDLATTDPPAVTPTAPVIVADPDFDLDGAEAAKEAKRLLKDRFREPPDTRALRRELGLGRVRRLPGTAAEAAAVAPRFEAWLGVRPRVFIGPQALKSLVQATPSPAALVLSTHGFFKEEEAVELREDAGLVEPARASARPFADPLVRCGLLFAACNGPGAAAGDGGILTGLDVLGCDLRGTKLVVLSACETGLGDVRNGEGVAGLRQAFQLAGAEGVVATLWQIPDQQSAQLMVAFFDQLGRGRDRDDALAAAQRNVVLQRRDKGGAAHPFFWAAYTFTGRAK